MRTRTAKNAPACDLIRTRVHDHSLRPVRAGAAAPRSDLAPMLGVGGPCQRTVLMREDLTARIFAADLASRPSSEAGGSMPARLAASRAKLRSKPASRLGGKREGTNVLVAVAPSSRASSRCPW
jgi:hypothetical protein